MLQGIQRKHYHGVSIYGPRRCEYVSEVCSLLNGTLPPGWGWVKSSSNTIVAKRLEPSPAYYKEFLRRSPFEGLKSAFRGSRCERAIARGKILQQKGFNSPAVHCWGRKGHRHFMVTEGVNAASLADYICERWRPPLSRNELIAKRGLIEKFAEEIGRLHKEGICHGDLRLNNVLVRQIGDETNFYFIDNERNSHVGKLPRRLVEKNLVQVNMIALPNVTRQDRLRFFRVYSQTYARFDSEEEAYLMRKVHHRTSERLETKMKRSVRASEGDT